MTKDKNNNLVNFNYLRWWNKDTLYLKTKHGHTVNANLRFCKFK